ncbi:MAG: hypothetical protein K2G55_10195 [Lachnospiraceae bacterium]|nr:hypothetical protein [Lachnospiraceae bacterium]MDE7203354.1 hypothetical protein [Lachnospiraceae bacterium]
MCIVCIAFRKRGKVERYTQVEPKIERIQKIPDVIRRMGKAWEMFQSDIDNTCRKIGDIAKSLQASQQTMGMQM